MQAGNMEEKLNKICNEWEEDNKSDMGQSVSSYNHHSQNIG